MSLLAWIAVLAVAWFVGSVVAALVIGHVLRRRREATDPHGSLRPLDTGPLQIWLTHVPAPRDGRAADRAADRPGGRAAPGPSTGPAQRPTEPYRVPQDLAG